MMRQNHHESPVLNAAAPLATGSCRPSIESPTSVARVASDAANPNALLSKRQLLPRRSRVARDALFSTTPLLHHSRRSISNPRQTPSTRHKTASIALRPDDEIRLEATSDHGEQAAVDYVEVVPAGT